MSRMHGVSNESVYEHFEMCRVGVGKKCGVVEEVKRQTFKWFGHMERMEEGKMTRRVYMSEIERGNVRRTTSSEMEGQGAGVCQREG